MHCLMVSSHHSLLLLQGPLKGLAAEELWGRTWLALPPTAREGWGIAHTPEQHQIAEMTQQYVVFSFYPVRLGPVPAGRAERQEPPW